MKCTNQLVVSNKFKIEFFGEFAKHMKALASKGDLESIARTLSGNAVTSQITPSVSGVDAMDKKMESVLYLLQVRNYTPRRYYRNSRT